MQYFIVDAFTAKPFAGNPAAVVIQDESLLATKMTDQQMQLIAAEFNLAETAFISHLGENTWGLRWFTPTTEIELCGHATLASAYTIWMLLNREKTELRFNTLSGELRASLNQDTIELDFPLIPFKPVTVDTEILDKLQVSPKAIFQAKNDLFIEVANEEFVRHYQADFSLISQLPQRSLTLTTATTEKDSANIDIVSRMFAPNIGIPEDSVTGAIHCTLAPYWAEKLGRNTVSAYQASKRGGYLQLRLDNDRVRLGGHAVCTMEGRLRQ